MWHNPYVSLRSLMQKPLSERLSKSLVIGAIGAMALASIVGGVFAGFKRIEAELQERVRAAAREIQTAVERDCVYSGRTTGTYRYPDSLNDLVRSGRLIMPKNPYTGSSMPILQPADPPTPGGVVYLHKAAHSAQIQGAVWQNQVRGVYTEDSYCLLVYGAEPIRISPKKDDVFRYLFGYAPLDEILTYATADHRRLIENLDSISWGDVAVLLNSRID